MFGPPGTGKTTNLLRQIARAAEKFGGAVAVASFTRAAARELVARGVVIDPKRVGTLHSLCLRSLADVGTIIDGGRGKSAKASAELRGEWNGRVGDRWQITGKTEDGDEDDGPRGRTRDTGKAWSEYVCLRNLLTPMARWPAEVLELDADFAAFLEINHATDFTGIVERVLADRAPLPWPVQVLFVDEAQDCTKLELAVLRMWGESCSHLVIAGDDQQAIYGFRGATPDAFLDPPLPEDHKTFLRRSWRLSERVKAYAVAYGNTMARFELKEFEAARPGGEVAVNSGDMRSAARRAAEEARLECRTSMILASCAYQLGDAIAQLRLDGTPYHNPYRATQGAWNPLRGACRRLSSFCSLVAGESTWEQVGDWVSVVDIVLAKWPRGIKTAALKLAKIAKIAKGRQSTAVEDADFAAVFGEPRPLSVDWLRQRLPDDEQRRWAYAWRVLAVHGREALTSTPKVIIGTIHSVKGGEADTVYLRPDVSQSMWLRGMTTEGRDEIKRLMYVGMTRAKDRLHILRPETSCYDRAICIQ